MNRVVSWYSCGITSAVATKLTLDKYPDAIVAYCDTNSEHSDNKRLRKLVWRGQGAIYPYSGIFDWIGANGRHFLPTV